jgi:hypothetical protein
MTFLLAQQRPRLAALAGSSFRPDNLANANRRLPFTFPRSVEELKREKEERDE